MFKNIVILLLMVLQCHYAATGFGQSISLSGADWRIHEDADGKGAEQRLFEADASSSGWLPANVPGNIQADLEAAHQLNPLWYGVGDPRLAEVAKKDWWYRRDFVIPAALKGRRLTLVFDGVDHECEVWVNGKKVGANAGMFRRFQFDVTEVARPGEVNRLAVRIARIPEALVPLLTRTDGSGVGSPFVKGIHAMRKSLKDLKSQTNWGWDWGVNIWTLGIWKDVRLEATGPARIDWTRVQTSLSDDHAKATVIVTLDIDSTADLPALARFQVLGHGQTANLTVDVALKKGRNTVKGEIPLNEPALWWPNGQGEQPLYGLRSEILSSDDKTTMDFRKTRFGVRDVRWVHTEGAPADFISRYQLIVNGRPVRTIGSNLIPADLLFGRMAPRSLNLFRQAKAAGINTLRLWGGGVILHEEAYNLADELGIMLVQEMPLANALPETDPVMLKNLETTVRSIVRQVRNHPSIIEYDGGNEMPWKSNTVHPALQLLQKTVAEEDERMFRATCPDLGGRHGPYYFYFLKSLGTLFSGTYRDYDNGQAMRNGEFGTSSPANLEVWQREMPPNSQWPIDVSDSVLIRKNISQAVFDDNYWLHKAHLDLAFGPAGDLPTLIRAGQFCGAEGLRYALDALRRKGKRIGGMTTWDFNEPWPNGAGSYMVDYDGRPLMNYDFVKQALAPVSLTLKYDAITYSTAAGVKAELSLTSDAPRAREGLQWKWLARDRRGRVFDEGNGTASIEPQEVKQLASLELKPPSETARGPLFVELQLLDSAGKLLTERIHIFSAKELKAPLAGLLKNGTRDADDDPSDANDAKPELVRPVTRTKLKVSALPVRIEGGQEVLELTVANTGKMTALFCEPHPLIEYRTDLFIENRNCFIPPGETRTITIRSSCNPKGGLTLARTGWRLSTWNAGDQLIEPVDDVLLAVGRRDQMCREFLGYFDKVKELKPVTLSGTRPDPAVLPYRLDAQGMARFEFDATKEQAKRPLRLRLHTADQSKDVATAVEARINDKAFEQSLPKGLGLQNLDPAHLAFPATAVFEIPAGGLRAGQNSVEIRVKNDGWFTWDEMDLVSKK